MGEFRVIFGKKRETAIFPFFETSFKEGATSVDKRRDKMTGTGAPETNIISPFAQTLLSSISACLERATRKDSPSLGRPH
jgi:hypothetical protein